MVILTMVLSGCRGAPVVGANSTSDCTHGAGCDAGSDGGTSNTEVDTGLPDTLDESALQDIPDAMPPDVMVCDATTCDGACVDTVTDPRNCGGCGHDCTGLPHVVAGTGAGVTCAAGTCVVPPGACEPGFGHCPGGPDDSPDNGCETDLTTPAHCGGCGAICRAATPVCAGTPGASHCTNGCAPETLARCGGACVDTVTDPRNCGGCGHDCTALPHATGTGASVTCMAGTCVIPLGACEPGFGHCSSRSDDGCETDLTTPAHCGSCGTNCTGAASVCAPGEAPGVYGCAAACGGPAPMSCAGSCVDTAQSPLHCGTCGTACSTAAHARATCTAGACGLRCVAGSHACGGACADDASPTSCGASCSPCPVPEGAAATCAGGVCGSRCLPGYHNCGGRCVDDTAVANCGTGCASCTAPDHGVATCDGRACGITCTSGYVPRAMACVALGAPRPIAPLSTATVTSRRPTLRWALPDGADGAHVEVCRDRGCGTVEITLDAHGTRGAVPMDLAQGAHYWRLAPRRGTVTGPSVGPTWEFFVGARSAPVDTSSGTVADFNGDGYADVVVGAYNVANTTGRAYVSYGGATGLPASPSVTLASPEGPHGYFGWSVASAGDTNGDGYADLVVTADQVMGFTGKVYVYLGSATGLPAVPGLTLTAPEGINGQFGWSVAGAGDTNGDGYADVLVGANGVEAHAGRAYLYLGSATGLPMVPSVTLTSPGGMNGGFGASVAGVGDVNGDGYADVAVGANGVAGFRGNVYVYLGGAGGLPAVPGVTLTGPDGINGEFGASVAGAGDVNGDGYADLVVGANGARSRTGGAYVYLGSARGPSPAASLTLTSPGGMNGEFGTSVAGAGDVNGDGYADLAVSAAGTGTFTGSVYVYLGGATGLSAAPGFALAGSDGMNGDFGHAVAGAGDTNGDGYADLVVGADGAASFTGGVYVYLGAAFGLSVMPGVRQSGPDGLNGYFGHAVARAPVPRPTPDVV